MVDIVEEYGSIDGVNEHRVIDAVQIGKQPMAFLIIKTKELEFYLCWWDSPDNRWAVYDESISKEEYFKMWGELGELFTAGEE